MMLKNISIYLAVKIFAQCVLFLSNLITGWILITEQFAAVGLYFLIISVLMPLSNFCIQSGVERFYSTFEGNEVRGLVFTSFVAGMTVNLLLSIIIFVSVAKFLPVNFPPIYLLCTLTAFVFQSSQYIPLVVLRATNKVHHYSFLHSLSVLIIQISVLSWLIMAPSVKSFFFGNVLGSLFSLLLWSSWIMKNSNLALKNISEVILYGLKSVPTCMLEIIQQSFDRVLMANILPSADFGLYAFAQRFAAALLSVSSAAKTVIFPFIYSIDNRKKAVDFLERSGLFSVISFGFMASSILLIVSFSFEFFVKDEYSWAYPVFLILLFGYFLKCQETIFSIGADIEFVPHRKAIILAPIITIALPASYLAISKYGLIGAAVMFALYCGVRLLALAIQANKILPRRFGLRDILVVNFSILLSLSAQLHGFIMNGSILGIKTLLPLLTVSFLLIAAIFTAKNLNDID